MATDTICVLMGMRRIEQITRALIDGGRAPETPAAVIQWGARPEQRVVTAALESIATVAREQGLSNPAVIVVGDVVQLRDKIRWYDTRPLFGRRILLPRPEHQARQTARAVYDRAAQPIVFPVIEIHDPPNREPLERAVRTLDRYDWVLWTSVNGVDRFFLELDRAGLDARAFGRARIGVIGPKTAAAVRRRGLKPDAEASEYTGEGLAKAVLEQGAHRVLLARARVARDALPALLRASGAEVDVVAAYETRPVGAECADELRALLAGGQVDVVLFTSGSTVDGVADLLGPNAAELLATLTVASIGPITTRAAAERGIRVDVTAESYTVDGLLDALEVYVKRGRS
jgi:uroporphyrinogen III methyltransferase/synthase